MVNAIQGGLYDPCSIIDFEVPKYVDFVDSFPMNAAGKILKYKMREEAQKKFCQA